LTKISCFVLVAKGIPFCAAAGARVLPFCAAEGARVLIFLMCVLKIMHGTWEDNQEDRHMLTSICVVCSLGRWVNL